MKKLVVLLVLMFSFSLLFSQNKSPKKIIFVGKSFQNIVWPSDMTMIEAKDKDSLKYPYYIVNKNTYLFDILNKKIIHTTSDGSFESKIISYKKNEFGFYFEILGEKQIPVKIAITQKHNGDYIFIFQKDSNLNDKTLEGFFTESKDMTLTYEY
jgi:hypothetical protein